MNILLVIASASFTEKSSLRPAAFCLNFIALWRSYV